MSLKFIPYLFFLFFLWPPTNHVASRTKDLSSTRKKKRQRRKSAKKRKKFNKKLLGGIFISMVVIVVWVFGYGKNDKSNGHNSSSKQLGSASNTPPKKQNVQNHSSDLGEEEKHTEETHTILGRKIISREINWNYFFKHWGPQGDFWKKFAEIASKELGIATYHELECMSNYASWKDSSNQTLSDYLSQSGKQELRSKLYPDGWDE